MMTVLAILLIAISALVFSVLFIEFVIVLMELMLFVILLLMQPLAWILRGFIFVVESYFKWLFKDGKPKTTRNG